MNGMNSEITDIWTQLKSDPRPLVLYGTGNGADRIIDILERENIKISGIFSSTAFVRDRFFRGYKVETFEALRSRFPDMRVLMCFGSAREEVLSFVREIAKTNEISAPDVPVYGENVFNCTFFEAHKKELSVVYEHLSDEKSRETFRKLVEFKLTGKIENLFSCEYDNTDLFNLPENCTYIDFGAYNGDTVLKFYEKFPCSRIIALEPDARNFRKLRENTAHIKNISYYNALVSDSDGTVYLDNNKGRGAHESGKGTLPTKALTVDSLIQKEKRTLSGPLVLKFDVEGNELKALSGAEGTIKELKPVIVAACYHRSEDYFTLPLKILSLDPTYKIYMRHYKGIPAWETDYIFIPEEIKINSDICGRGGVAPSVT
ncbi:MAG: FkbM family methyltransferase [Clostridia bacterium]|nr:FkbM family methyltransferase [Clostridia bacterium]